jgi:DNA-nicking Smr family endonuclease
MANAAPMERDSTPPPREGGTAIDALLASPVVDVLDLHGSTRDEARIQIEGFVVLRAARGGGVVRIITGRGVRAGQGPVLRGVVHHLLSGRLAAMVRRYQSDLGGGAVLVDIR